MLWFLLGWVGGGVNKWMGDVGVTNAFRGSLYPSLIPPIPHTSAIERGVSVNLNLITCFFFSLLKIGSQTNYMGLGATGLRGLLDG